MTVKHICSGAFRGIFLGAALLAGMGTALMTSAHAQPTHVATHDAERGRPYEKLIAESAKKHQVPLELAHAVIKFESNYNPQQRGSAGEVGLMQVLPATARGMGYSGSTKNLYEPQVNIEYGMRYLAEAHRRGGGDTCKTILKYNAGHFAKKMNPVSASYCSKVKSYLATVKKDA